jgi:uncharacterized membrane protein
MEKTTTGLSENVAGMACYALGWVTGIIFLLLEPQNKNVRFHAFQSIIIFGILNILYFIFWFVPVFGWIVNTLIGALAFILWVVLMVKTFQGQKWELPAVGALAERWAAS